MQVSRHVLALAVHGLQQSEPAVGYCYGLADQLLVSERHKSDCIVVHCSAMASARTVRHSN